jgi:hypothetical protein
MRIGNLYTCLCKGGNKTGAISAGTDKFAVIPAHGIHSFERPSRWL